MFRVTLPGVSIRTILLLVLDRYTGVQKKKIDLVIMHRIQSLSRGENQNGWQKDGRRMGSQKNGRQIANRCQKDNRTNSMIYTIDFLLLSVFNLFAILLRSLERKILRNSVLILSNLSLSFTMLSLLIFHLWIL